MKSANPWRNQEIVTSDARNLGLTHLVDEVKRALDEELHPDGYNIAEHVRPP